MERFEGIGLACGNFKSIDVAKKVFGGENTIQTQMQVEAALARVQAKLGIIPQEASDEINKKCDISLIDEDSYRKQYAITNHPLVCLIRVYASILDGDAGEYLHFGTTTQDIMDTATMLQLKQAHEIIVSKTLQLRDQIITLAQTYKSTIIIGRTNDQQALPITLGLKMATWIDELNRSIERLTTSKNRIFVGTFFGATGTLASLKEQGITIQQELMKELGLGDSKIMWFSSRDRIVELVSHLCILCGTLGRIANEIYNGQRTEVNELSEAFIPGKVGSSTMPHKRNPFIPSEIVSYGRLARSIMVDALTAMEGTNERDARSLFMENEFLARACSLTDAALSQSLILIQNLEIHPQNIKRNLELTNGLIYAEALMMELSKTYGRLQSHEIIYELAQHTITNHLNFKDVLLSDSRINKVLNTERLESIMEPSRYIGLSEYFVDIITKNS